MAFTMACPNFKKGLKMVFGPLGVNITYQLEKNVKKVNDVVIHKKIQV
jgi:hypothetical protein